MDRRRQRKTGKAAIIVVAFTLLMCKCMFKVSPYMAHREWYFRDDIGERALVTPSRDSSLQVPQEIPLIQYSMLRELEIIIEDSFSLFKTKMPHWWCDSESFSTAPSLSSPPPGFWQPLMDPMETVVYGDTGIGSSSSVSLRGNFLVTGSVGSLRVYEFQIDVDEDFGDCNDCYDQSDVGRWKFSADLSEHVVHTAYSVSLSNDATFLAVGDGDFINWESALSRVYVFERTNEENGTGLWNTTTEDSLVGVEPGDAFGFVVDIVESFSFDDIMTAMLAVGAPLGGYVHLYVYSPNLLWEKVSTVEGGYGFGTDVSLTTDAKYVAVGNPWANNRQGFVSIHSATPNDGSHDEATALIQQQFTAYAGHQAGDWFGHAVSFSVDGSRVAVGCDGVWSSADSPYVVVLQFSALDDELVALVVLTEDYDDNRDRASSRSYGRSLSLNQDGTALAVGGGAGDGEHVRVYHISAGNNGYFTSSSTFIHSNQHYNINYDNDNTFGHAVSLSKDGTFLAVASLVSSELKNRSQPREQISSVVVYLYTIIS